MPANVQILCVAGVSRAPAPNATSSGKQNRTITGSVMKLVLSEYGTTKSAISKIPTVTKPRENVTVYLVVPALSFQMYFCIMMNQEIAGLRTDYKLKTLNEEDVAVNAIEQFTRWWNEAVGSAIEEVNAMTLATISADGMPSARIVLLKNYDKRGFVFYTNYDSAKGKALAANPKAALVFFWKELERQVRIQGMVEKVSAEESDEYFNSRPAGSRIGAWSSPQSEVIPNRHVLENNVTKYTVEMKDGIPRPEHWGGYRVTPSKIEFWQGRSNRLHDRIQYTRQADGNWQTARLAP